VTGPGRIVVIGVGNEFRCDDGAGPAVAERLRGRLPEDVRLLVSDGEPTRLLEAWTGASAAIVADAVTGGPAAPGTLHRLVVGQAGPDTAALAGDSRPLVDGEPGSTSSHGLGLGTAVGLARALGRMPAVVIVHAVQGADFSQGYGLSAPVAAAIDALADAILADVSAARG
jgi:hydrogenase maturation protease